MRIVASSLLAILLMASAAVAQPIGQFSSPERILGWAYAYRAKPQLAQVPAAVSAMRDLNLFRDEDGAGFLIGFLAGVLGKNERKADWIVRKMFPMPAKEQAVIIKTIAYSGLPGWKQLLTKFADRMPERKPLIDDFLSGKAKTLMEVPLEEGPHVVYTLWGYYVATGYYGPVTRIVSALRWASSKERGGFSFDRVLSAVGLSGDEITVDRAMVGSTAKWTLASHAERDRHLVAFYREQVEHQSEEIALPLAEVIEAAERFEAERLRKQEFAAVEEVRQRELRRGSTLGRGAYAGSVALSGACVIAGALGQPHIAVPCVIAGVLYSGAAKIWQNSQ